MRHKWKWLCIVLIPVLLTTGCWDSRDPEDRDYVITLGVDVVGDTCVFSFAPAKTREKEAEPFVFQGKTLAGAVAKANAESSGKTDLGQLKMVIFGKNLMERPELFSSVLGEIEGNREISGKIMVLATEDKSEDCIKAIMEEDNGTGLFLWDFYKNTAKEVAVTKGLDMETFLTQLMEQKGIGILPRISLKEEKLRLGGGVVLEGGAYVRSLQEGEEEGYLFLLGEGEGAVIEAETADEVLSLRINDSKVAYDFLPREDGGMDCYIRLRLKGTFAGRTALKQEELKNLFAPIIKAKIENTIAVAKKTRSGDFSGIELRLMRQIPDFSGNIWEDVTFFIEPKIEIQDTGRIR